MFFKFILSITGLTVSFANEDVFQNPSVIRFREYLQINTSHPNPSYEAAITWFERQAAEIGLEFVCERYGDDNAIAILMTWRGSDPSLETIIIASHMDTVFPNAADWSVNPFVAFVDDKGFIYGRGAVDMKSHTLATLEGLRNLKEKGFQPLRDVIILVTSDEELDHRGMIGFVNSETFRFLRIGVFIDEGYSANNGRFELSNNQRVRWQIKFYGKGRSTHSANMPVTSALGNILLVFNQMIALRQEQFLLPEDLRSAINLVLWGGNLGPNIQPSQFWTQFDLRLFPSQETLDKTEAYLSNIVSMSNGGVEMEYVRKDGIVAASPVGPGCKFWPAFLQICSTLEMKCVPHTHKGETDGNYALAKGVQSYGVGFGFTKDDVIGWLHEPDEAIHITGLLKSIKNAELYIQVLSSFV